MALLAAPAALIATVTLKQGGTKLLTAKRRFTVR
jgi:hypothetical protein